MKSLQTRIKTVFPKALEPGGTIGVISPAAPTLEAEAFEKGIAILEKAGHPVKLMPHAQAQDAYLAGSDVQRLSDLHRAFADPDIKAILCARGGYGCLRLLKHIDYNLIEKNPKVFIGFSDVTVLHTAFYQRTGLVGFYGPMLTSNLINEDPYTQDELFKLVRNEANFPYSIPNQDPYTCYQPGIGEGPLIGGNLSLLVSLCGTPFQPNTDDHILFIEDWREQYYTLDRQFQHLKLAGLFENIQGLILCDFCETEPLPDFDLTELLRRLTHDIDVPTGYGFSVGHGKHTATFPIGSQAQFNASTGSVRLLESPVH